MWRDERVSSSFQEDPHEGNDCVEQEEEWINDEQSLDGKIEKILIWVLLLFFKVNFQ